MAWDKILSFGILVSILLFFSIYVDCWHGFDNTAYHCWPLSASESNPTPIDCKGLTLQWISKPTDQITIQQPFNMTYELLVDDTFYTWATNNNYFSNANITGITDATKAKEWCENTTCPAPALAREDNCCVWHVNVHSCPLSDTVGGLCGPWIPASGSVFTHSEVMVGPIQAGMWISHVGGLYSLGLTSLIAHFKLAGIHVALETKLLVVPSSDCGDGECDALEGETCDNCPVDCGGCPLKTYQLALIGVAGFIILVSIAAVIGYFQYQKRKLLWDESWIIPFDAIKEDAGLRGAFGSMLTMDNENSKADLISGVSSNMVVSAARKQVFAKTAIHDGRTVAIRKVKKREFTLSKDIRWEVKSVRESDHANLCKFVGGCIEVPNVCILTEYCPKGSLSDVLMNDDVALNWPFRFSFATDIARGMTYLHSHKMYHGRLKSNNCVVDDRWCAKITDYGLTTFRKNDEIEEDGDDEDVDAYYQEKRAGVYKAPEVKNQMTYEPSPAVDVYSYAIILIEIATRNDPYGDEDPFLVPPGWKPELPELTGEDTNSTDDCCPCPVKYLELIEECWREYPEERPSFEYIKKTLYKINPSKLSPIDMMMAMMEKYSKNLEAIVADRTQDLMLEKQKTDRLLYSMLPKAVADDLRLGRAIDAEQFECCTIYFSDIVGFTTLSGGSTPFQVVALLNKLYITFDEIIDKYDVYKVETIGDAYMVVSGIPTRTPFHAREVSDMAIDLVEACKVFEIPHRQAEPLKIRVGLHSGPACAGVVGLKMPRYCLFGDTVNTASRMESNGEAYRIHISNSTYTDLANFGGYRLEKRGTIPIKGKGEMTTWWLLGHDDSFTLRPTTARDIESRLNEQSVPSPFTCISSKATGQFKDTTNMGLVDLKNERNGEILTNNKTPDIFQTKMSGNENNFMDKSSHVFPPVELPGDETPFVKAERKVSNISNSNDSGYNDKENDDDLSDVQEIRVKSFDSVEGHVNNKEKS